MAQSPRRKGRIELAGYFFIVVLVFAAVTLSFHGIGGTIPVEFSALETYLKTSIVSSSSLSSSNVAKVGFPPVQTTTRKISGTSAEKSRTSSLTGTTTTKDATPKEILNLPINNKENGASADDEYSLAGLNCAAYGGPSEDVAREMVYWKDIPADNLHVSPLKKPNAAEYLTFEPDEGGWNNIRMALETVIAIAFAMGRTLVLPPEDTMYLLGKGKGKDKVSEQRNQFSFNHFFHMEAIHKEHPGLDIISMDEYLEREVLTGRLRDKMGNVVFPPNNRTNWDGNSKTLFKWLRKVGHLALWDPDQCLAAFPATSSAKNVKDLRAMEAMIKKNRPGWQEYVGKPTPVDAPAIERMKEMWVDRSLCIYDEEMQAAPLVHFPVDRGEIEARLLVHFYAFLFFENYQEDLWAKRFIRDHVRYLDEIQCAAARVVAAVRKHARERDPTGNPSGVFDSFHIRRGDFQYKATRIGADEIYQQSQKIIPENATVFIATDERDMEFFKSLKDHYDVVFLDDFHEALGEINTNYYGMIDQLVASRGRFFFGCWFSTFTGYINRLRGYHADSAKSPGYQDGVIPSWYYVFPDRFDHMQMYYPIKQSFFAREFPTSWRLIDSGMEAFHAAKLSSKEH